MDAEFFIVEVVVNGHTECLGVYDCRQIADRVLEEYLKKSEGFGIVTAIY